LGRQNAEKVALLLERQIKNFIEKERTAIRQLESAAL
jgi:hypothetical protein